MKLLHNSTNNKVGQAEEVCIIYAFLLRATYH